MIAEEVENISNVRFIWITDGKGWDGVGAFKEAYEEIPYIFNLTNIQDFVDLVRSEQ